MEMFVFAIPRAILQTTAGVEDPTLAAHYSARNLFLSLISMWQQEAYDYYKKKEE